MSTISLAIPINIIDAIFRPSRFVQSKINTYANHWLGKTVVGFRLTLFYFVNVIFYAIPLTVAGFGFSGETPNPPPIITSTVGGLIGRSAETWGFLFALGVNSAYLLVVSLVIFVTFHAGVFLVRRSEGILQSFHTIVYSTSIYLAGLFTLTWYLSTSNRVTVADEFVLNIQKRFVYLFIDLSETNLELPGGQPEPVSTSAFTLYGQVIVVLLILLSLYLLYSLYLGARINHNMTRRNAIVVVTLVILSPAVYVLGSLVYTINLA